LHGGANTHNHITLARNLMHRQTLPSPPQTFHRIVKPKKHHVNTRPTQATPLSPPSFHTHTHTHSRAHSIGMMEVAYLRSTVGSILSEGLAGVAALQPADPVTWLGEWLHAQAATLDAEQRRQAEASLQEEAALMATEEAARLRRLKVGGSGCHRETGLSLRRLSVAMDTATAKLLLPPPP